MFETIAVTFLLTTVWFAICNERTYRYRKKMINDVFGPPYVGSDYDARHELRQEFMSVSYYHHIFHNMMFRNVSNLYPKYHARKIENV